MAAPATTFAVDLDLCEIRALHTAAGVIMEALEQYAGDVALPEGRVVPAAVSAQMKLEAALLGAGETL